MERRECTLILEQFPGGREEETSEVTVRIVCQRGGRMIERERECRQDVASGPESPE